MLKFEGSLLWLLTVIGCSVVIGTIMGFLHVFICNRHIRRRERENKPKLRKGG